jgi:hypothetical protein
MDISPRLYPTFPGGAIARTTFYILKVDRRVFAAYGKNPVFLKPSFGSFKLLAISEKK